MYFKALTYLFLVLFTLSPLIDSSLVERTAWGAPSGRGRVQIDDTYHEVTWSDGDSFRITSGRMRGQRVRLLGYNTLESYGPVHKWGDWNEWQLYRLAKDAKKIATRETWECRSLDIKDRYSRLLVRCPKLIEAMLISGTGHIFEIVGVISLSSLVIFFTSTGKEFGEIIILLGLFDASTNYPDGPILGMLLLS